MPSTTTANAAESTLVGERRGPCAASANASGSCGHRDAGDVGRAGSTSSDLVERRPRRHGARRPGAGGRAMAAGWRRRRGRRPTARAGDGRGGVAAPRSAAVDEPHGGDGPARAPRTRRAPRPTAASRELPAHHREPLVGAPRRRTRGAPRTPGWAALVASGRAPTSGYVSTAANPRAGEVVADGLDQHRREALAAGRGASSRCT